MIPWLPDSELAAWYARWRHDIRDMRRYPYLQDVYSFDAVHAQMKYVCCLAQEIVAWNQKEKNS